MAAKIVTGSGGGSSAAIELTEAERRLVELGYRLEAIEAYHDDSRPLRVCHLDGCAREYRGPSVYCTMPCALADAGITDGQAPVVEPVK